MKKFILVTASLVMVALIVSHHPAMAAGAAKASAMTDAGNKFCPVSGDKVSGKDFLEHEGKRYGLCCAMCTKDFKKNPKKYIAKMEEQEKAGEAGAPPSGMIMH